MDAGITILRVARLRYFVVALSTSRLVCWSVCFLFREMRLVSLLRDIWYLFLFCVSPPFFRTEVIDCDSALNSGFEIVFPLFGLGLLFLFLLVLELFVVLFLFMLLGFFSLFLLLLLELMLLVGGFVGLLVLFFFSRWSKFNWV